MEPAPPPSYKFRAFISYSHEDQLVARRMHRSIESYRVPHALRGSETPRGPVPARLGRLFLDDDETKSASDLGALIRGALEESESLIVLCSPHAARSPWVDQEIQEFRRLRDPTRIFPLIVAGRPHDGQQECFPPSLRHEVGPNGEIGPPIEPLAVDLHRFGPHLSRLKLIASLLDLDYEQLRRREHVRARQRFLLGSTALLVLAGLGLGWFTVQTRQRLQRRSLVLAQLAEQASDQGSYDSAMRYASRAMIGHDHPVLGFDPHAAEVQIVRAASSSNLKARLEGHTQRVHTARFSPDDALVVTTSDDGTARIWDVIGGSQVAALTHDAPVLNAAFTTDTHTALTATATGEVKLWDVDSQRVQTLLQEPDPRYKESNQHVAHAFIDISPDGSRGVVLFEDRAGTLWDLAAGSPLFGNLNPDFGQLWYVAFSPDSQRMAAGFADGRVVLWDARTGQQIAEHAHEQSINALEFSPDSTLLASGGEEVFLVDAQSGKRKQVLLGHRRRTRHLSFSPDSDMLVSMTDEDFRVWDTRRGREVKVQPNLSVEPGSDSSFAFASFVGPDIVALKNGPLVHQAFLRVFRRSGFLEGGYWSERWATAKLDAYAPYAKRTYLHHVELSPDRRVLATVDQEGMGRLWRPSDGAPAGALNDGDAALSYTQGSDRYRAWDFNNSGSAIATVSGHTAYVWNTADSLLESRTVALRNTPRSLKMASQGDRLLLSLLPSGFVVLGLPEGEEIARIGLDRSGNKSMWVVSSLSPDGRRVVSGAEDGTVGIWDVDGGALIRTLSGHGRTVTSAVFSCDGRRLVTGSLDGTVRLWDAGSGEQLHQISGIDAVTAYWSTAALSPRCDRLATVSNGVIRIWNSTDFQETLELDTGLRQLHDPTFSPDGTLLFVAAADGESALWRLSDGSRHVRVPWAQQACFSPDGHVLLTTDASLFDVRTGKPLGRLAGHPDELVGSVWSPDGRTIVTAAHDDRIRFWDAHWWTSPRGETLRDAVCQNKIVGRLASFSDAELQATPELDPAWDLDACAGRGSWLAPLMRGVWAW